MGRCHKYRSHLQSHHHRQHRQVRHHQLPIANDTETGLALKVETVGGQATWPDGATRILTRPPRTPGDARLWSALVSVLADAMRRTNVAPSAEVLALAVETTRSAGAPAIRVAFGDPESASRRALGRSAKSDAAARFAEAVAREVRILSKLHHPNIVRYVESFADAGSVFIVMELAEGASLAERIAGFRSANARAPEPLLWDVHTQVLLALRYLESEAGVVHRDITPNNILVDRDARRVKLVDFGLAKTLGPRSVASSGDANEARDSESNAAMGTMPYSAPEMIMGEPYGHKADVWSLGCVLYHAAALTPAFGGSNPLTVASQIVEGRFERLEDATPPGAYSRNLLDAVGAMLVVDPAARPSAEAVMARRCAWHSNNIILSTFFFKPTKCFLFYIVVL